MDVLRRELREAPLRQGTLATMRRGEKGRAELKRNLGERETAFIFSLRKSKLLIKTI